MKRLILRDRLLDKLVAAQKKRNKLDGEWIETEEDEFPVAPWVVYERDVMLQAVNLEREQLGKAHLTRKDIFKVEQSAYGHSDYSSKFALYCAELVLDRP